MITVQTIYINMKYKEHDRIISTHTVLPFFPEAFAVYISHAVQILIRVVQS
jgi:hypothetical protein